MALAEIVGALIVAGAFIAILRNTVRGQGKDRLLKLN